MNMFEMSPVSQENKEKEIKGVWDRVFDEAISQLPEEFKQDALELKNDPSFKIQVKGKWDQRTAEGSIMDDAEKQEEVWAKDLAEKIKDRIENKGQMAA